MTKLILKAGGVATAIGAMIALYVMVGGVTLATSADIKRLDRAQVDGAIDFYRKAVRDSTLLKGAVPQDDINTQRLIDEDLAESRDNLKRLLDRKIELLAR